MSPKTIKVPRIKRDSYSRIHAQRIASIQFSNKEYGLINKSVVSIALLCEHTGLNASEVRKEMRKVVEGQYQKIEISGWVIEWMYVPDFREMLESHSVPLTEAGSYYHGWVNQESRRKADVELLKSLNDCVNNYSGNFSRSK